MWGEVQVQDGIAGAESQKPGVPSCAVDGEGEGHGGLWGATLTCSSLSGFAATHWVVGVGLPLVNRDRLARSKVEGSEDKL